MSQNDPLVQLRDIHLPEPVSWWPPAPGWWIVAFAALSAVVALVYLLHRRFVKNRYRRIALKKLSLLKCPDKNRTVVMLEEISAILRRVAIQTYGRQAVAPMAGDAWLSFLDKTGQTLNFSSGAARVLGSGLYRQSVEADIDQVRVIAEKWIREHR